MKFYSLIALVAAASAVRIAPHQASNIQVQSHGKAMGHEKWPNMDDIRRHKEEIIRKAQQAKKWVHEHTA